jgi:uncharacterized protein (UPF0333 family)
VSQNSKQFGFAAVELLLTVLAVVLVAVAGVTVYNARQSAKQASAPQTKAHEATAAPAINNAGDLTSAEKTLDNTNVDDSAGAAQLDSDLASF